MIELGQGTSTKEIDMSGSHNEEQGDLDECKGKEYKEFKYSVHISKEQDGLCVDDQFISCVLSGSSDNFEISKDDSINANNAHSNNGVIILLHGSEGHKDYCYHKILAVDISNKLRLNTMRFDFRNSGDSSNSHNPRTIKQDTFDLQCVVQDLLRKGFEIKGIVAHSRGSLAMFQYAIHNPVLFNNGSVRLVNVAGRFNGQGLYQRLLSRHPNLLTDKGYFTTQLRFGERVTNNEWISIDECNSLIGYEMDKVLPNNFSPSIPVLNVYGTKDSVIPYIDSQSYYKTLQENGNNTKLVYIDGANHNFHGVEPFDHELHTRLTKHKRRDVVDYSYQLSDIIIDFFK